MILGPDGSALSERARARVLVVDDDRMVRDLLHQCLRYGGYDVVEAADGGAAITILESGEQFDVVVTDYEMPVASGVEVIRAAQRINPGLPCVVVTAYREIDLAMEAMSEGAVGFIPKPFKPSHLLTVVDRARERGELAAEAVHLRLVTPMLERFTVMLGTAIEAKDRATQRHCERMVRMSSRLAVDLGTPATQVAEVRLGAALHDVGKVSVPLYMLVKPGALTPDEHALMRRHPEIGAAMLEGIESWDEVRQVVRHHHEHYDGSGYPDGLAGTQIPLGARIVAVTDAFDVMRRGRAYSEPKPVEVIVAEMLRLRGLQFDPDCVDAFLPAIAEHEHDEERHQEPGTGSVALEPLLDALGSEPARLARLRHWEDNASSSAERERNATPHPEHLADPPPGDTSPSA